MRKFLQWGKAHWQLIFVVLFGAFLRFYQLRDLATFGGDQGVDYQFIARMIFEGKPRLLGPITHVGVYLGPLYYYILVPFFLLFRFDPIAVPFLFALVGSLTVGLVYLLGKKLLPESFAFCTALLYAVSPVIVESSKNPSQPNLIPFFATLFLISMARIIEKKSTYRDGILLGTVLGAVIQFHYLTFPMYLFFIGVMGWLLLTRTQERKELLKLVTCCLLLVAILFSPWLLFELRNNFFITQQIIGYLQTGEVGIQPIQIFVRFLDLIWFSVGRLVSIESQFLVVGMLVIIIASITQFWKSTFVRLLFFYTAINLFGIALYKDPLSDHYIAVVYPSVVLLAGIGISTFFSKRVAVILFLLLVAINLKKVDFARNHGHTMPDYVNTKTIQIASRLIAQDWRRQGKASFNIANTLDGDTRAQPYRYVLIAMEKVQPESVEHYPDSDVLYVVTNLSKEEVLRDARWELASFPVGELDEVGRVVGDIVVYRMIAGEGERNNIL